jgi:hypothetical protein
MRWGLVLGLDEEDLKQHNIAEVASLQALAKGFTPSRSSSAIASPASAHLDPNQIRTVLFLHHFHLRASLFLQPCKHRGAEGRILRMLALVSESRKLVDEQRSPAVEYLRTAREVSSW